MRPSGAGPEAADVRQPNVARPPTLDERIVDAAGRLTSSETVVARHFAEHRTQIAFLSAAEIAATLEVSDATVIRTAQALGYQGLPELKRELRETIRWLADPGARYAHHLDALGDKAGLLDHFLATQVDIVNETRRSLRHEDFRHAVDLLGGAGRIVVVGLGPLAFLAEYFVLTLRRTGRSALSVTGRGVPLVDNLMELRAGDVLVLLAYERVTPEADVTLRHAAARDVPCVLITDHLALALDGRYATALSAGRGGTDAVPSLAVPLLILEALIFGVIGQDRPRALAAFEELNRLRQGVDAGGGGATADEADPTAP